MEGRKVITNRQSGTNVHEIADGIYRINTPIVIDGAGAFSFNQYPVSYTHLTLPTSDLV